MKVKLTDVSLRNTPAPEIGKTTFTDTERPALMFRITANDVRSWLVQKKVKGDGDYRSHLADTRR